MRIDVLTLFPNLFTSFLSETIIKRAQEKRKVRILVHDIRKWAAGRHKSCDDRPYGGGAGMVLRPEPIDKAVRAVLKGRKRSDVHFVFVTPHGKTLTQKKCEELAKKKSLVLLCGRYEGVDQRVVDLWADEEISIGDYVLSGGEIPAMAVMDTVVRLVPGVLGNAESKTFESFTENLLEYPHFTRPEVFRGVAVPPVLLSGNHKAIEAWRRQEAVDRTRRSRPDLLKG